MEFSSVEFSASSGGGLVNETTAGGRGIPKMSTEMPTDQPGSLSQQSYAAILAFILQSNEFPSGSTELASNADRLEPIPISSQ